MFCSLKSWQVWRLFWTSLSVPIVMWSVWSWWQPALALVRILPLIPLDEEQCKTFLMPRYSPMLSVMILPQYWRDIQRPSETGELLDATIAVRKKKAFCEKAGVTTGSDLWHTSHFTWSWFDFTNSQRITFLLKSTFPLRYEYYWILPFDHGPSEQELSLTVPGNDKRLTKLDPFIFSIN